MGKIGCVCGHVIYDQSDVIRNKAHFLANQDYYDYFSKIEGKSYLEVAGVTHQYFNEMFQCNFCNRLILFRNDKEKGEFFVPENKEQSSHLLQSSLGAKWKGSMAGNFIDGKGSLFWNTNIEVGNRYDLGLEELRTLYAAKYKELSALNVLEYSFLRVEEAIEHEYKEGN